MSGRGGRGGRGRGGSSMSFNVESLGFGRGELLPQTTLAPAPTFPALNTQPLPLFDDEEHKFLVSSRMDFIRYWNESDHYISAPVQGSSVDRYSDRYLDRPTGLATNRFAASSLLPAELRIDAMSTSKRKCKSAPVTSIKRRVDNSEAEKRLEALEKSEAVTNTKEDGAEKNNEREEDDVLDEEEPEEDAELDDGTDYANDFFDNGESYLDQEDDALEEGPVF